MRRTLTVLSAAALISVAGQADDSQRRLASAPLPAIPSLPPIPTPTSDAAELNWKKATTRSDSLYEGKASDPADLMKNLPNVTDEQKKQTAAEKKSEPLGEPKKLEPTNDPKKLKEQLAELVKEREGIVKDPSGDPVVASETAKLRKQMMEMFGKLEQQQKKSPPTAPHADPKKPGTKDHPPEKFDLATDKDPLDKVRAAFNLYKSGEVDAAARAFKMIDKSLLTKEDRAFTQYMTAGCLRKTGKTAEALVIYREMADAKEDGFLTECALWQLGAIRSAQELETQLEQLRARRKAK